MIEKSYGKNFNDGFEQAVAGYEPTTDLAVDTGDVHMKLPQIKSRFDIALYFTPCLSRPTLDEIADKR